MHTCPERPCKLQNSAGALRSAIRASPPPRGPLRKRLNELIVAQRSRHEMPPSSTGASNGRTGGRISVGERARSALQRAPQVTVRAVLPSSTAARPPKSAEAPAPASPPVKKQLTAKQLEGAKTAAAAVATACGLSAEQQQVMVTAALAAVAASKALESPPQPVQQPQSRREGKRPLAASVAGSSSSIDAAAPAASTSLTGQPRGSLAVVGFAGGGLRARRRRGSGGRRAHSTGSVRQST